MKKIKKIRADDLVLNSIECESKSKAQALIMAGVVEFLNKNGNWELVKKAGQMFPEDTQVKVDDPSIKDVGRGAQKLRGAFEKWPELKELAHEAKALDIGASTGGFTQVLLENGVHKVFALDVGTNQLHEKLRNDPRVISVEKQHVLKVTEELWEKYKYFPPFEFIVSDLSFISLSKVIPHAEKWLKKNGVWILLVKPQFELSADKLIKGIVKEEKYRQEALEKILTLVKSLNGLKIVEYIDCPLAGTDGNQEYLLYLKKE